MYLPTNPHEWGTGGIPPADWEGYSSEPFAAEVPSREEEASFPLPPPPAVPDRCLITCVTPVQLRRGRGLVVKHGEGWLDNSRCPCCGEKAAIEFARPVQECAECGGIGHVPHAEPGIEREPGAFRQALWAAREVLRIRPREAVSEAKECQVCDDLWSDPWQRSAAHRPGETHSRGERGPGSPPRGIPLAVLKEAVSEAN